MARESVFVSRPYHSEAVALLDEDYDVEVWPETNSPPKPVLVQMAAQCRGMLVESYDVIDSEVIAASVNLKAVSNRAVGTDNLAIAEATARGILLGNTPGVLQESCADFAFALLLDVARRVAHSDRAVREGRWTVLDQTPYLGADVHGSTLGIIGLGGIGTAVAKRARGCDMRVLYLSRTRRPEAEQRHGVEWAGDLETLLKESDYVSLHVPLTDETRGLIGRRELSQMRREAFLVNTSRGGTVDLVALHEALAAGEIAGAGLDVTVPEPISMDDPLLSLPNVVVTPHIASASAATFKTMATMAARNIIAALQGRPMPSCINPEAYGRGRQQAAE